MLEEIPNPSGRARLLNDAYMMLAGARQNGMSGAQPIQLTDAMLLYDRLDIDMTLKEFIFSVQEIDSGFMEAREKRQGGAK